MRKSRFKSFTGNSGASTPFLIIPFFLCLISVAYAPVFAQEFRAGERSFQREVPPAESSERHRAAPAPEYSNSLDELEKADHALSPAAAEEANTDGEVKLTYDDQLNKIYLKLNASIQRLKQKFRANKGPDISFKAEGNPVSRGSGVLAFRHVIELARSRAYRSKAAAEGGNDLFHTEGTASKVEKVRKDAEAKRWAEWELIRREKMEDQLKRMLARENAINEALFDLHRREKSIDEELRRLETAYKKRKQEQELGRLVNYIEGHTFPGKSTLTPKTANKSAA